MIFPKSDHFKVNMYINSLLGLWPYIFEDSPVLKRIYSFYSYFIFRYYILFILSAQIRLFILLQNPSVYLLEIFANLSITMIYSVTIARVNVIKSQLSRNMIREVIDTEERICASEDEKIIEIYKSHCRISNNSTIVFLTSVIIVTALYFVHPLFVEDLVYFDEKKNRTIVVKPLPFSSWFPYNVDNHYLLSYCWHILDGTIGASFVCYTDCLTFSLIIYPLGQINILNYILSNLRMYIEKVRNQLNCTEEEAAFITLRECILKHNKIIRYMNDFNKSMSVIMMFDFLLSSLQLASILLQLVTMENNFINFIYFFQFAIATMIRLLLYYWSGNEIIEQSSNTTLALWATEWYELPPKVQDMVRFMMLRSKRSMKLDIGPFNSLSLRTLLKLLKATYSYIMVFAR